MIASQPIYNRFPFREHKLDYLAWYFNYSWYSILNKNAFISSSKHKDNLSSVWKAAARLNLKHILYREVLFALVNSNLYLLSSSLIFISYLNSLVTCYVDFFWPVVCQPWKTLLGNSLENSFLWYLMFAPLLPISFNY